MHRDCAIQRLLDIEREMARLHAERAELLVAVATTHPVVDELLVPDPRPGHDEERTIRIEDAVREELAAALRWSPSTAHLRIDEARLLAGPLSSTASALREGEISAAHVGVIVQAARRLNGRHSSSEFEVQKFARACARLEQRVLPTARRSTVSATRRAAERAALAVDPHGAEQRRRSARCTRDVFVTDEADGISTLIARVGTEQARAVMAAVHGRAETMDGAASAGVRRADALCALVLGSSAMSITLDVVVPLDSLLGHGVEAATVAGVPVVMGAVHDLLSEPDTRVTMRRLVIDPLSGHLLDRGPRSYRIPDALRAFIVARDERCRFPGCGRRSSRCQIDHAEPFDNGGATSVDNLGALCTRHHQLKTHAGWEITASRRDGSCDWRSPDGRSYRTDANSLRLGDPPPD